MQQKGERSFLTASWSDLIMLNWEIDPEVLLPYVPHGTELDGFRGSFYISVVAFRFQHTRVLSLPVPFHMHFEELNLRFYVRREVGSELRRGVVFVKEFVPRRAIAALARWLYNENYVAAPMNHSITIEGQQRHIKYSWLQNRNWQELTARCSGEPEPLGADTLEEFIAEHYWGYTRQRDGGTIEYRVEHPRWNVWRPQQVLFEADVAALYGAPFATVIANPPALALVADGSPVTVRFPTRIS